MGSEKKSFVTELNEQREKQVNDLANPQPLGDIIDNGFEEEKPPLKKEDSAGKKPEDKKVEDGKKDSAAQPPEKIDWEAKCKELEAKHKDELEKAEKRIKDNQASFHQEHQTRLGLETKLTEAQSKLDTLKSKKENLDEQAAAAFEEGDKVLFKQLKEKIDGLETQIKQKEEDIESRILQKIAKERQIKDTENFVKDHPDYYDVVNKAFKEGSPEWESQCKAWRERGGTAQAAYEIAQAIIEQQEYLKDPQGFIARKIEESKKTPASPKKNDTLPEGSGEDNDPEDDSDDIPDLNLNSARGEHEHNELKPGDGLPSFLNKKPK